MSYKRDTVTGKFQRGVRLQEPEPEVAAAELPISDFAPFPEEEMHELAKHFESISEAWPGMTDVGKNYAREWTARANAIRQAIASARALRERCTAVEMERDHLLGQLDGPAGVLG